MSTAPSLASFALPLGLVLILTFLLGSIPFGLIISRLFYKTDIREHGSGNIGATNALRSLGKVGGGVVFLLDFAKGLLAGYVGWSIGLTLDTTGISVTSGWSTLGSLAGGFLNPQAIAISLAFVACVCGHVFSPWLKFKGGKGVAVAAGCIVLSFSWLAVLLEVAIFILVVALTRIVSAASISAAFAVLPISLWLFWGNPVAIAFYWIGALIIIWAHRGNIARLRAGTEKRFGIKKAEAVDQIVEAQAAGWAGEIPHAKPSVIASSVGAKQPSHAATTPEIAAATTPEIPDEDQAD